VVEDLPSVLARPVLRGWLHLVCFFLAIPAGVVLIVRASAPDARAAAVVYAIGLVALFGVSGSYHRGRWSDRWRQRMRRLDHATIFVMIAGSYTPLCVVALDGWVSVVMLVAAWTGAAIGAVLAWTDSRRSMLVRSGLYIALGWSVLAALPQLVRHLSTTELVLIAIGGLLYTVGAIFLATHWPDPSPRVFGYHEVWHTFVVAAAICQFIAIGSVIEGANLA
jgi:hemolysin III